MDPKADKADPVKMSKYQMSEKLSTQKVVSIDRFQTRAYLVAL